MAGHKKQLDLRENADGVLGILISRDQYREYVELQEGRDRSEMSLRAQMRAQNQHALELARLIVKSFDRVGYDSIQLLMGESAGEIYDRANEILAEE